MVWVIVVVVIVVLIVAYNSRRRTAEMRAEQVRRNAQLDSYAEEMLERPADVAVKILTEHMPTLVEKAATHVKRDEYDVVTLGPEFDGEIRYFVDRVILADPNYLSAANEAMKIDPDARARLFDSSIMERLVRNTVSCKEHRIRSLRGSGRTTEPVGLIIAAACLSVSAFAICFSFSQTAPVCTASSSRR